KKELSATERSKVTIGFKGPIPPLFLQEVM
ncbi:hypothetical protein NPIL_603101, partial [Nephila pilipes]